ncbi:MAG TPA: undecaprenyldiphospho-muramoylpentapeptide beta-N-acetylglucosaminyltransferase [Acidobacteriota bacterium]|nr:undecaprenyldiphospho-muramoylpentapeptide beta-N-acetylglucosaminyltransferase [Acidobacteriota bacterium]
MRVLLAAGGTGGHVIPALRIAEAIVRRRPDTEMLFVGSDRGFEERVIAPRGYRYVGLPARGFSRRQLWRNIPAIFGNLRARTRAGALVRDFAPDVAVGCGGYASYFPIRACAKSGIRYVLQEQNSYPGLVTRWLAANAQTVFTAFPQTARLIRRQDNIEQAGNPVDPNLTTCNRAAARKQWGIADDAIVLLITGGSSGARSINNNIARGLAEPDSGVAVTILWQTGRQGTDWSGPAAAGWNVNHFAFTDHMTDAMVAADLVIARAGALTVSEIAAAGKPAILVPYPFAAADHQTQNARSLADAGGAEVIADADLDNVSLLQEALALLNDPATLRHMGKASRNFARPEAAGRIADRIIVLGEQR